MNRSNAEIAKLCGITVDELEFTQMIDEMPIEDRIEFRKTLERDPSNKLPRNLYYDYDEQRWF